MGRLAQRAGWSVEGVALRESSESRVPELLGAVRVAIESLPACDMVIVAVTDDALSQVGQTIASTAATETHLLHTSGSRRADVFAPHVLSASLHPLASLPSPGSEPSLEGVLFVAEGAEGTIEVAAELVRAARGRIASIDSEAKALYHAAAVMGSNYVATLAELAFEMMTASGVGDLSRQQIAALAGTAIDNWRSRGLEGITGPIARGDAGTIGDHLAAIDGTSLLDVYRALGLELVSRLGARGPEDPVYQEIAGALERSRAR